MSKEAPLPKWMEGGKTRYWSSSSFLEDAVLIIDWVDDDDDDGDDGDDAHKNRASLHRVMLTNSSQYLTCTDLVHFIAYTLAPSR